jgi:hypothetical protein
MIFPWSPINIAYLVQLNSRILETSLHINTAALNRSKPSTQAQKPIIVALPSAAYKAEKPK